MAVTDMSTIDPSASIHDISPVSRSSPYTAYWWTNSFVQAIPESSVAWMLAQGWQIISTNSDTSTTPATTTYNMGRQSMQNWLILQTLMNSFTSAYNEGRAANDTRYEDIVRMWDEVITKSQTHYDQMGDVQNAHVAVYVSNLTGILSTIDAHISAARTSAVDNAVAVTSKLDAFITDMDELVTGYNAHLAAINTVIATESSDLTTFLAAHEAALDELETEFDTHLTAIRTLETTANTNSTAHIATLQAQLDAMPTEYTSHKTVAEAFLTDLGTTELARINERFDNLLASSEQKITDRGFYSSNLVTQSDVRIERERDEAIAALNDKLNREKLDNEHKLYDQLVAMRDRVQRGTVLLYQVREALRNWKTENESRLQGEQNTMRIRAADGIALRHSAQQDVSRNEASQRTGLYAALVKKIADIMDGRQQYAKTTLANTHELVDARYKLASMEMEMRFKQLEHWGQKNNEDMTLYKYQIDARNNLMIGLFGFMERRTDEYPDISKLAELATSLGDSGATSWVTP